ncbi:MAG: cobalamin biosynthesis protein CobW, partial [Erysipelotrichaceae bacterium]|nr:cobalamin biosynthesis protein CobW [Erysipelotrichaceae bacterium]
KQAIEIVKELNEEAIIVDRPIEKMSIEQLLDVIVSGGDILPEVDEEEEHHHHHDHDHEHEHHHDHDHEHHHHDHHHHHDDDDEDEPFKNLILRPEHRFTKAELEEIFTKIPEDIIRIKGYVLGVSETLYFNYVLNEYNIFSGSDRDEALVSIIGTQIDHELFEELFHD